ncbi:MAG: proton-conducting transporter membrane subunit [Planctomycetota bacterium]
MTNPQLILLIAIPAAAGLINIALAKQLTLARTVGCIAFGAQLTFALIFLFEIMRNDTILVSQMGDWPAPFGITIVFDCLSGLLIAGAGAVALGAYVHAFALLPAETERRYFHALMQFVLLGVNMSFLTGDLFNLFVAFEVMLLASYPLLTLGATRRQTSQAYKYVLLNLLASTVFVMAAGMTYGMFGTLNIADLSRIVHEINADPEQSLPVGFTALGILLLLVFALKGAFFPLWFWLPDAYPTTPTPISGFFAGVLTKVGVYSIARIFTLVFAVDDEARAVIYTILAIAAAFTMFLGVLGAVCQHEVRRILAIHVISQVGYMAFGLVVLTPAALAGVAFHIVHNMVVKSSLFLCCGAMEKHAGTDDLDRMGSLLKRDTLLAILLFIAAMSLVGLPPLSGFYGKLIIIREGWTPELWWLSIVGLLTGALTLLSMLKIWSYGFWSPKPKRETPDAPKPDFDAPTTRRLLGPAYVGITLLVALALYLGFGAQSVYDVAIRAGEELADPSRYIASVLQLDESTVRAEIVQPADPATGSATDSALAHHPALDTTQPALAEGGAP